MQPFAIKVPIADNDGIPFPKAVFEEFEAFLITLFGGFSGPSAPVRGVWVAGDGVVYRDTSVDYIIGLSSLSQVALVPFVAASVLVRFRQEAVWVCWGTSAEVLSAEAITAALRLMMTPLVNMERKGNK